MTKVINVDNEKELKDFFKNIREEWNYLAEDENGDFQLFTHEPEKNMHFCKWIKSAGSSAYLYHLFNLTASKPWNESLVKRPLNWKKYQGKLVWFYDDVKEYGTVGYLGKCCESSSHPFRNTTNEEDYRYFEPLPEVDYTKEGTWK